MGGLSAKSMFIQMLTEGTTPTTAATKSNVDNWTNLHAKNPYTIFKDPDGKPFFIVDTIAEKHAGFILERETRKIVYKGDEKTALAKVETLP